MKKQTKSLLEEINSISPSGDKSFLLESRGKNAINSIINLLETIEKDFGSEAAADFNKRIILSIKNKDDIRFVRGIQNLRKNG
jgi:hypothetical protein